MGKHICPTPNDYIHGKPDSYFKPESDRDFFLQHGHTFFIFPTAIAYYLCDCGWQPPQEFIEAVMNYKGDRLTKSPVEVESGNFGGPERSREAQEAERNAFIEKSAEELQNSFKTHNVVHVGYLLKHEVETASKTPEWKSPTPFVDFMEQLMKITPDLRKEKRSRWHNLDTIYKDVEKGRRQMQVVYPAAESHLDQLERGHHRGRHH